MRRDSGGEKAGGWGAHRDRLKQDSVKDLEGVDRVRPDTAKD